ncbi:MAG TPA: hypothetical protein VFX96_15545 [Pyrinomonadaceae bacterium]|nr:hypothetical protein [Pyrinomonadaceae bacterium]
MTAALLLCLASFAAESARAQSLDVKITLASIEPPRVRVEGRRAEGSTAWSFRNTYAGMLGLAARVENLVLLDEGGAEVALTKRAPGEYESARPASRFRYEVNLDPPTTQTNAAHVSWLTRERGLLMLGDLLPLPARQASVKIELPAGWKVTSGHNVTAALNYQIEDAEDVVFLVARDLRSVRGRAGSAFYASAVTGAWAFDDGEVSEAVAELLKEYEKMFGGAPRRRATVIVTPFPRAAAAQTWSAETRGETVTIVTGAWPSKVAAVAQLGGVLSHELLHLWVPNGLALDGDYDWFYEGFTLYLAMRARMRQGQVSFQDYLNTLGRAFDAYAAARGSDELSLVELSRRRWAGSSSLVYNKGMLVAFLYDLALMRQTGGKSSLEDVYRALYQRHGEGSARADGNASAASALGGVGGMKEFVRMHVESPVAINLAASLAPYGLRAEAFGVRTRVTVAGSPGKEQRELLKKLGYNEKSDATSRRLHEKLRKRTDKRENESSN